MSERTQVEGPETDWAHVYRTAVGGIGEVAGQLTAQDAGRTVPATPEWTVRQVFAHLAGGSSDVVSGRIDGAPGPAWTDRHVAEREGRSVAELVAELQNSVDAAVLTLDGSPSPALVWDKVVHLCDLTAMFGFDRPDPGTYRPIAEQMRPRLAHLIGDVWRDDVDDWTVVRATFSRLSQRQLRERFPGAPDEALARVGFFGPRDDDQPLG